MTTPSNPSLISDPLIFTGLLNKIPIGQDFIWRSFVSVIQASGTKWETRSKEIRAIMAKILDHGAKLPFGLKGKTSKREGGFMKVGLSLPIDPEELIAFDRDGTFSSEILENAGSIRLSIESAIEWIVMRGLSGQSLSAESNIDIGLGSVTGATTTATTWSNVAATGIADLVAKNETSKTANQGKGSSLIIMSNQAWVWLRNQTATQALIHSTAGIGSQVPDLLLTNLLRDNGLPPVLIYDAEVEVESGKTFATARVLPEDLVILLPSLSRFPSGLAQVFIGRTGEEIIAANEGLIPPNLGSDLPMYGWVEKQTGPARIEVSGQIAVGFNIEATAYTTTLDIVI